MARATLCEGLWLRRVRDLVAGVTMTALCPCQECDSALRRIASDAGDEKARAHMTEPERRRANGELPFNDGPTTVATASNALDEFVNEPRAFAARINGRSFCAIQLRALVLQQLLVTFSTPWNEVTP